MSLPDWPAIEPEYRAGLLSIKDIADHHFVSDSGLRKHAKANGWTRDLYDAPDTDWDAIEAKFRAGQLSIKAIGHQHGISDTAIRGRVKALGWTRDLSEAVRHRVRESLIREGVRSNELAGVTPSDAAIIDEAAAIGIAVVRSHRSDIDRLRKAATGLIDELGLRGPPAEWQLSGEKGPMLMKVLDRSRVLSDLAAIMARLIPLERQAFGLDEDRPGGSVPMTVIWEGMPAPAYD